MRSLQRSRASVLPRRQTSLPPMRLSLSLTTAEPDAGANGSSSAQPASEQVAAEEPAAPRWTPPAPTVDPDTAPKKTGWWGKR
jgi:hypothetical protein